jgi:hypothetical protein
MPRKPKIVWVGTTPVTPLTSKERKKLHKLMKKRLDLRRRKYSEVRGKVVDYISHSIDDGILCMNVCFKDKTLFSFRFACDMFIVGADLSDWKMGNYDIIREYMKPIPRTARTCGRSCWPSGASKITRAEPSETPPSGISCRRFQVVTIISIIVIPGPFGSLW